MEVATLTYRLYQDSDLNGILGLWKNDSGWGAISATQFREWHMDTPYGNCMIVVADDDVEGIIGQMIFVPSKIWLKGKEISSYRIMAPIIKNDFRGPDIKDFDHPAYAMIRFGIRKAEEQDYQMIYIIPSIGWVQLIKTFPRYGLPQASIALNDCLAILLSDNNIQLNKESGKFYVQQGSFDKEYDQLWEEAVRTLPIQCAVSRNSKWLKWKRGPHLHFEMRNQFDNQLRGYIVIKKNSGLVVDFLARSVNEIESLILLTIQLLRKNTPALEDYGFTEMKFMQTPTIDRVLLSIPHDKIDFRFAFVNFFLNAHVQEEIEWFIMPDD